MYVVTFYSFKGGVGRTMALVNTAFNLTQRGRRVLIVDFDLEAPGISTYETFTGASQREGVVDYVSEYMSTNVAPQVDKYISPFTHGDLTLWVMSAGRRDHLYADKLASIDWPKLYREHDGFLMFEDLKQQWERHLDTSFDYVLIDSRTGHTDVGGICTRQLPNAVVLMFFPNAQNILGLSAVARDIRTQARETGSDITLLFCPSNVPDLDDENEILRRQYDRAREALDYDEPAATVHHYNSLELLDQAIFAVDRPRTRLAEEYRELAAAIIGGNLEDREGAIQALEHIRSALRGLRYSRHDASRFFGSISTQIDRVQRLHPKDGEIAWELASIYNTMGNLQSEFDALTVAIANNHRKTSAMRMRAKNLLARNQREGAIEDLRSVLKSRDAQAIDVSAATELLRQCDPDWISAVEESPVLSELDANDKLQIAEHLTADPRGARLSAQLIRSVASSSATLADPGQLMLSLIGSGQFEEALRVAQFSREAVLESGDIQLVFNFAMAEWGVWRKAPVDLIGRTLSIDETSEQHRDANYHQCLALCHAVLGNGPETRRQTAAARRALGPGSVFSCWRYLKVGSKDMLSDLDAIDSAASTGSVHPAFLDRES